MESQDKIVELLAENLVKQDRQEELLKRHETLLSNLVERQDKHDQMLGDAVNTQHKTNSAISELRISNIRLAEVLEKLASKIDKVDDFERRLKVIEEKIL